jgi:L-ascorbate metabolism protein UlaG (beta-lactamase superfamily)
MTHSKKYYLKEDAYFEPLFNHWYAWPYLLPPVTGARHLVNTHRRIMTSFVNNYELHIMAIKEKGMAGAEFLNCEEEQLPQIKSLIEELDDKCADLVALSDAVKDLEELLRNHTSGETIEPLYSKVPSMLQGYVELFLDMEHRASYRLIEPLLYQSSYYKPSLQTLSFGLLSRVDERPFVLSTPRLPDANHLQILVDFNHPLVDTLFRSREIPLEARQLEELFKGVEIKGGLNKHDLFTTEPSKVHQFEVINEGVRVSYTGHAGFLVETPELAILIDPVITSRGEKFANDVISYSQLPPKIDYILLTHNHQDHVNFETLLQLRYKTNKVLVPKNNGGTLADPSIRLMVKQLGFTALEVDDLDQIFVKGGKIIAVPFLGEHGDLHIRSKTAWYIELLGRKLFFGADSSNPDNKLYEHLEMFVHDIDILAIGMECIGAPYTWLYGALHTKMVSKTIKNSRRLNGSDCKQALPMVKAFSPKDVFIYALGMEPWYKYFMGIEYDDDSAQIVESNKMLEACKAIGVSAEALYGKKIVYLSAKLNEHQ